MKRKERARSFLFEPSRFINDKAVLEMHAAAAGCYLFLFCAAWDQEEPGVLPDNDRLLCNLARSTPEEWQAVKASVARAFDTESRPGFWVQRGLVETFRAQNRHAKRQSWRGKLGAKALHDKKNGGASMTKQAPVPKHGDSVLGSRFLENQSQNTPSPRGSGASVRRAPEPEPEGFAEFYAAFPRRTARRAAAKAFASAIRRHPDVEVGDLVNAARWYSESVAKAGTEPRFVPMPATWLNQDRFLEEFA